MAGPHPEIVPTHYKCGCELVQHPKFTSNAIWETVYAKCPEHVEVIRFSPDSENGADQ